MRRKYDQQRRGQGSSMLKRAQSYSHFTLTHNMTLAQLNHPSTRHPPPAYHPCRPLRVALPDYFNVPRFSDHDLFQPAAEGALFSAARAEAEARRKVRDLGVLAEGMRRAKNIKEESRYYFTQGVLQHNCRAYADSIASLQKFLKIVLFIRDEKSVELALNAIGAEYMALGDPQTALEFHRKQASAGPRADTFLSHSNCGLCFEMAGDYESALAEYTEAERSVGLETADARRKFIGLLIGRASSRREELFITAEQKQEGSPPSRRASKARIVAAIRSAEQHLDTFLSGMKDSFLEGE